MIQSPFSLKTWTYLYVMLFFVLVGMNFFPFLFQADGRMIGGFKLEMVANLLHLFSGMWAATALWCGDRAMRFYFQAFGTTYFLDGVVGLLAGKAFLNLNLFHSHVAPHADLMTKILLNIPHLGIGGLAMIIGWCWFRK